MAKKKTVLFEDRYNVDINEFSSTDEIDNHIEKEKGRKIKVRRFGGNIINSIAGNVLPVKEADVNKVIDKRLKH